MKRKKIIYFALAAMLILLMAWLIWENQNLMRTDYTITSDSLPDAFDGFTIVQISDLHNAQFGKGNNKLLEMIGSAQPDIIAITGDVIDSRRTNVDVALEFAREAMKIAPCYYVTGNHELRDEELEPLLEGLETAGVIVLRGEAVALKRDGQLINIVGIDDPTLMANRPEGYSVAAMQMLEPFQSKRFTLLLAHNPQSFDVYCENKIDVALTGHTHGGQIRIPGIGGLYASGEFFPEFDAGIFQEGETTMVISRGLGNSLMPLRVNNRPEVVVVTLRK